MGGGANFAVIPVGGCGSASRDALSLARSASAGGCYRRRYCKSGRPPSVSRSRLSGAAAFFPLSLFLAVAVSVSTSSSSVSITIITSATICGRGKGCPFSRLAKTYS